MFRYVCRVSACLNQCFLAKRVRLYHLGFSGRIIWFTKTYQQRRRAQKSNRLNSTPSHRHSEASPPRHQVCISKRRLRHADSEVSDTKAYNSRFLANTEYPYLKEGSTQTSYSLPQNESVRGLAAGLKAAFKAYSDSELGLDRCVIFLIQGGERNVFDQRHLEYELKSSSPLIPVFRLPFAEILQRTRIADTPKRQLIYRLPSNPDKEFEVSVVYMRSGYGPSDYPDQTAWDARYHLERSNAIKCPTVLTQLAGAKKVQQILATPKPSSAPSELGRFIPEETEAWQQLWETFTNIYPMDDSEPGQEARKLALDPEACQKYVLKPQREGGGNNFYKASIPPYLQSLPESHWKSYILMELITPPPVANVILRNGNLEQGGVICELGIYGTCVWNQNTGDILHNEQAGYLLRTKGDQSEEGGVAAGFGCMDSCTLV